MQGSGIQKATSSDGNVTKVLDIDVEPNSRRNYEKARLISTLCMQWRKSRRPRCLLEDSSARTHKSELRNESRQSPILRVQGIELRIQNQKALLQTLTPALSIWFIPLPSQKFGRRWFGARADHEKWVRRLAAGGKDVSGRRKAHCWVSPRARSQE